MCRQREKSAAKSSPSSSSGKSSGKGGTSRGSTDRCYCCAQVGHRRPDCTRRNENCSQCGKRGHLRHVCRSSGGNTVARAVEVEPAEPDEETLSVCDISELPLDALSVCDNSDLPSNGSGNLLNIVMNSGADEHVVSLADWKSIATGDDMVVSGRLWCVDGAIIKWWS